MKKPASKILYGLSLLSLLVLPSCSNPNPISSSEETSSTSSSSEETSSASSSNEETSSTSSSSEESIESSSSESTSSEESSESTSQETSQESSQESTQETSSETSEETSESSSSSSTSGSSIVVPEELQDYYKAVDFSKSGAALKTSLSTTLAKGHVDKGYDFAYTAFKTMDVDNNGKLVDIYSSYRYDPVADKGSSFSKEGDGYNREHMIPQSVFDKKAPMKADLHHLYPTDGVVNNRRSNYPHAYVASASYTSTNNTLVGSADSTASHGASGTVCEPLDQWKGDVARTYFYFVTRYQSVLSGWGNFSTFTKNAYPSLSKWAVETYLEWNDLDPVDDWERHRNEEAYGYQGNRNPFVDFQDLAHHIWDGAYSA